MPRHPDIGWQHGKMVGGRRHHVQCNYCHRVVIGGITRFKKHLASKRGEVKGCDAAPKEIKEIIQKQLSTLTAHKMAGKKQGNMLTGAVLIPHSTNHEMNSDASDSEESNTRQEPLSIQEIEHPLNSSDHQYMGTTAESVDAVSSASEKELQELAPPRATDLGWAHGSMVNGDRQKIVCRYCHKVILGGGVSRLKQHLAGERGNIAPCEKVPDEVKAQIQQHLGYKILEKLHKQKELGAAKVSAPHRRERRHKRDGDFVTSTQIVRSRRRGKEVDEGSSSKIKQRKLFVPQLTTKPHSSPLFSFVSQEIIDQADIAVAKFMYHAGIPLNAANSFYFQGMADAIAAAGPGYKMPSYHSLRGKLLGKCILEVDASCDELRKSWEVTGCTVMVDRWTDRAGQTIIDVFVYCTKGTIFLLSVDAFVTESSLDGLVSLFDNVVQKVGPENIVNFLIDTTPCYVAAAKILIKKYKTFFWTICANHCVELMLQGLGKLDEVKNVLERAKKMCQLIYNNEWVLNFVRKQTEGREIFQSARTEFLTKFRTLQNIVSLKDCCHHMFTSTIWEESAFAKQRLGVDVREIVLDPQFWLSSTKITRVSEALITVLEVADSKERPSIGYMYDAMDKAKKNIISAFDKDDSGYLPYLEVIAHAQEEFHSPLHATACYLNPSIYYKPSFSITSVIQKGLLDCIETLEPNTTAQDNITRDKAFFEDAAGDFSRPMALRGRESLAPATWWSQYASDYPDLQRFAVRILSQTCSISTCERNRAFNMSSKNRLEHQRLNDLSYVHYNLGLQQKQAAAHGVKAPTEAEYDPTSLEGRNSSIGDWIEDPGLFEEECTTGMDDALPSDATPVKKEFEYFVVDGVQSEEQSRC